MQHLIYFDGAITKNPGGDAGYGFVITHRNKNILETESGPCREAITSNQAEYYALIRAMKRAISRGLKDVVFCGDSKLIINQMAGNWKVKEPEMRVLWKEAKILLRQLGKFNFKWVDRDQNWMADDLSQAGKIGHAQINRKYDV